MIRPMLPASLVALASVAVAFTAVAMTSAACIVPSISTTTDAGSSAAASGTDAATATVKGASCTAISASISLCEYISACPTLVLSPRVFPQCGFWIHGSAIDPECLCQNQYLCPVGHPLTCAAAATAAGGDTTYDSVCQQALTGGCQDLTAGSSGGGTSAACQSCVSACDNVPSCIDACGC